MGMRRPATFTSGLAHKVSILGRYLSSQPRAKTSITIMRALQSGHGQGSTGGVSGVISGGFCASAARRLDTEECPGRCHVSDAVGASKDAVVAEAMAQTELARAARAPTYLLIFNRGRTRSPRPTTKGGAVIGEKCYDQMV
jgi:hypothetical protein